jgi:hypothetical protein
LHIRFYGKGQNMKPTAAPAYSLRTAAKIIIGLAIWLVLVVLAFYTLLVLPLLLLVSAYLVYLVSRFRKRDAQAAQRHGYYNEE